MRGNKVVMLRRARENAPRDDLGLTAAEMGSVRGVEIFARFMGRELLTLSNNSALPECLRDRLRDCGNTVRDLGLFCDGYDAAKRETWKE